MSGPGPWRGGRLGTAAGVGWLLLVFGNYFAVKLRQMWPTLESLLEGF